MALTTKDLAAASAKASAAMKTVESELNAADRHLGDGDTGQTVRRVFEQVEAAADAAEADLGAFFLKIGRAAATATGSSLGTLLAVSLLEAGKRLKGRTEMELSEIGELLGAAEATILSRGGASLGDKTVADMFHAVGTALRGTSGDYAAVALAASKATLDDFRQKPNKMGRARMFAEKSVGLDDPGMLAFHHLVGALAAGPKS